MARSTYCWPCGNTGVARGGPGGTGRGASTVGTTFLRPAGGGAHRPAPRLPELLSYPSTQSLKRCFLRALSVPGLPAARGRGENWQVPSLKGSRSRQGGGLAPGESTGC